MSHVLSSPLPAVFSQYVIISLFHNRVLFLSVVRAEISTIYDLWFGDSNNSYLGSTIISLLATRVLGLNAVYGFLHYKGIFIQIVYFLSFYEICFNLFLNKRVAEQAGTTYQFIPTIPLNSF